jgi:glycosyltransferase involved in cell wall biosynthesis
LDRHSRNVELLPERYALHVGIKLLYVGRISKEKNLPLLAEVFKRLVEVAPQVQLVLVGNGPYLQELRSVLEGTPTVFSGYLEGENLATVYASCDLFVFPSTTDTLGNVILEAQASGLPVIVTDCGGPQENMRAGLTGLVAAADDAESLLEAIQSLLDSPDRRRQMARAARHTMEGRSCERAFDRTWAMYQEQCREPEWPLVEAV